MEILGSWLLNVDGKSGLLFMEIVGCSVMEILAPSSSSFVPSRQPADSESFVACLLLAGPVVCTWATMQPAPAGSLRRCCPTYSTSRLSRPSCHAHPCCRCQEARLGQGICKSGGLWAQGRRRHGLGGPVATGCCAVRLAASRLDKQAGRSLHSQWVFCARASRLLPIKTRRARQL
eukprot:COSAG01_NODE_564_length_15447_cov_14.174811_22_plen_176_part_00